MFMLVSPVSPALLLSFFFRTPPVFSLQRESCQQGGRELQQILIYEAPLKKALGPQQHKSQMYSVTVHRFVKSQKVWLREVTLSGS